MKYTGHYCQNNDISFNTSLPTDGYQASQDGLVKLWNMEDLTEPPISLNDNEIGDKENKFVLAISFSPDGKDTCFREPDADTDNLIARPTHTDYMVSDICSLLYQELHNMMSGVYM